MIFLTIRGPSLTRNRRPSDTCKHGGGGHPGYLQAVVNQADVFLGESKRPAAHIEVVTRVPASLHDATRGVRGVSFYDMRDFVNQQMCPSGSIKFLHAPASFPAFRCLTRREC